MGCFLPNIISHGISCDHFSVCVCMLRHTSISGVNFSSAYSTRKQAELLNKDGLCMCACVAGTFPIISTGPPVKDGRHSRLGYQLQPEAFANPRKSYCKI